MTQAGPPLPRDLKETFSRVSKWQRWVLGLMVAIGVVLFWQFHREDERLTRIDEFTKDYDSRGGNVYRSYESVLGEPVREYANKGKSYSNAAAWTIRWRVTGLAGAPIKTEDLPVLSEMHELEILVAPCTKLDEKLIECLGKLPRLKTFTLSDCEATDETLALLCRALQNHMQIVNLRLGKTQVTEQGIQELRRLKGLHGANIESPHIKDPKASFLATRGPS